MHAMSTCTNLPFTPCANELHAVLVNACNTTDQMAAKFGNLGQVQLLESELDAAASEQSALTEELAVVNQARDDAESALAESRAREANVGAARDILADERERLTSEIATLKVSADQIKRERLAAETEGLTSGAGCQHTAGP